MATNPVPIETSRRERRKLEVRERIVEAAIALFDEQGFEATKVADICERADVANKTFFNHFRDQAAPAARDRRVALDELFADIAAGAQAPGGDPRATARVLRAHRRQHRRGRADAARAA